MGQFLKNTQLRPYTTSPILLHGPVPQDPPRLPPRVPWASEVPSQR